MPIVNNTDFGAKRPDLIKIKGPNLLLTEGWEDRKFLIELVRYLDKAPNTEVIKAGIGKELKETLEIIRDRTDSFRNPKIKSVGIIRDAEENEAGANQGSCGALYSVGLSASQNKLIPVSGKPKPGILILPGKGLDGCLETVCLESIQENPRIECINKFTDCVERKWEGDDERRKLLAARLAKMRTHAFLATYYEKPDVGFGDSFNKRDIWDLDHPAFDGIKAFLKNLCETTE